MNNIEKATGGNDVPALGESFWNQQYRDNTTGWDLGEVSPPLKAYIDQLDRKDIKILIPGCGNSYEASYLLQQGFSNITVIDIAPELVTRLNKKFSTDPHINIILGDLFEHEGKYELVLEQTFFCALDPKLRSSYVKKMHELLVPGGRLCGVLFNRQFDQPGPPFGGSEAEYLDLFQKTFDIKTMAPCYNSFEKRSGNELFINLRRKN